MRIDPKYQNTVRCFYLKECELIESSIEAVFRVSQQEIASGSRQRNVVEARMALFSLFRQYFLISTQQLGSLYNRNHSTVLYNLKACEDLQKTDKVFNRKFTSAEAFVQERLSSINSEVKIERDRNRYLLWYCVDSYGTRKMFLNKPQRAENWWRGQLIHIDYHLLELLPDRKWDDEPLMVEMKIIGQAIQEKNEL